MYYICYTDMINEFSGEGKRKRIYRFFPLKNQIIVLTLRGKNP